MAIVQATVPQAHLATAMGAPNQLLVEYNSNILLPVPGPKLFVRLRRNFLRAVMDLNEFLVFAEDAREFFAAGGRLDFPRTIDPFAVAVRNSASPYEKTMASSARDAMDKERYGTSRAKPSTVATSFREPARHMKEALLVRLANANYVFHEMFEAGLLTSSPTLFDADFAKARNFSARCVLVLQILVANRKAHVPRTVTNMMILLADQALAEARQNFPGSLHKGFIGLSAPTKKLLVQWLVAFHLESAASGVKAFAVDLMPDLGFAPKYFPHEWAMNRRERMKLGLGTPELRGPLATEPVPPQGTYRREDYVASRDEVTLVTAERLGRTVQESLTVGTSSLRQAVDSLYYSGGGTLNQLTAAASKSLLAEERRSRVLSIIQEFSESRESATIEARARSTASTVVREAAGIDSKLAATHHRFKAVLPVDVSVEMYDAGLTWSPRVFNPFFRLHRAIRKTYADAKASHVMQFYVPEPLTPAISYETYYIYTTLSLKSADDVHYVTKSFHFHLEVTDRQDYPDFANSYAEFTQEDTWRNDSDNWDIGFEINNYSGGTIRGEVWVEMEDEDHWEGSVYISIPVLRYDQGTVNRLADFQVEMRDYEYQRQALEAQAHQYAHIKQREFIERHERLTELQKIVFEALIRRVCSSSLSSNLSYYKEIISRCIDWPHAKIEFEAAPLDALIFPDFPADHFVNSPAVRFFLPIIRSAETTLLDTLTDTGSFLLRNHVENTVRRIDAVRDRLAANGPDQLDRFSTEMVIGEHIEAVMSEHDHAS